jgi:hypothetical protein
MAKVQTIVSREWISGYIATQPRDKVEKLVGRALVQLLKRQTREEQSSNTTNQDNGVGFTGSDGRSGALTAKSYLKNGSLQDWQLEKWTKPGKNGFPRLAKYAKQLNEIALEKAAAQAASQPAQTTSAGYPASYTNQRLAMRAKFRMQDD